MIAVVIVVLLTHNSALGVFVGVLLSALFIINQLESSVKSHFQLYIIINVATKSVVKFSLVVQIVFTNFLTLMSTFNRWKLTCQMHTFGILPR